MKHLPLTLVAGLLGATVLSSGAWAQSVQGRVFAEPPAQYRPTVTIDEGAGWNAPLAEAARRAIEELDAGGIMFNPQGDPGRAKPFDMESLTKLQIGLLDSYPATATPWLPRALPGEARFGTYLADGRGGPGGAQHLGYLTPEWFSTTRGILEAARRAGLSATFYDEAGFPSGSADKTVPTEHHRKILRREEETVSGGQAYRWDIPAEGAPIAVVALDTSTGERVDLLATAAEGRIDWSAPWGNWLVQRFYISTTAAKASTPDYYGSADPLDAEATRWFLANAHDRVKAGLPGQFGSTIKFTFFDDVGIFSDEKTWHPDIATRFEALTGRPATLYYPALWEDIGPETAAARVAFFRARSDLLGETFPKLLTDWAHEHGVRSTGHAPGNYDLQPTDTIGDPFKFYGHTDVPMADVLWGLGFARGGFKLISSVSAQRDLPLTAAEAFSVNNSANGYRRMIELYVRGINHFIVGARQPSEPMGTGAEFNQWAGRSSYLLQGGRHVADIGVLFPIESLQAFYSFNAPENAGLPAGVHAYRDADYQAVGEMLFTDLHRDFTFIHPEALAGDKIQVRGDTLQMSNAVNDERYSVLVVPGGEVMSTATLAKIRAFWEGGGAVIATSRLPSRSAEFGKDEEVQAGIAAIFGEASAPGLTGADVRANAAGGRAVFLAQPSPEALQNALDRLEIAADVRFSGNPTPTSGNGVFGYIHRQRDGKDIYYFGNSSDTPIETVVSVRGRLTRAQFWNPHDGTTTNATGLRYREDAQGVRTEFDLRLGSVATMAVVGVVR